MNSNNIIGTMLSYNRNNFIYRGYFDVLFQKILDVYSGRFGSEFQYNFNNGFGGALYLGYNDFTHIPSTIGNLVNLKSIVKDFS